MYTPELIIALAVSALALIAFTIFTAEKLRRQRNAERAARTVYVPPVQARNTYVAPEATRHIDRVGYDWTK